MQDLSRPVARFANVLAARGWLALTCGVLALAWPDAVLLRAMMLTGVVLAASGVYEMVFAVRHRRLNRGWPLALADGAACLALAALTATLTVISYHATLLLASFLLFVCGVLAVVLALALWPMRRTRLAMLGWAIMQLLLAAFAAFDSEAGLFTLLYVGAGYAIALGVFQIAAARWMRRVAIPRFEPTLPHRWLAASQA